MGNNMGLFMKKIEKNDMFALGFQKNRRFLTKYRYESSFFRIDVYSPKRSMRSEIFFAKTEK